MSYEKQTISQTLEQIITGEIYLPAIQRKFVWSDEQIIGLMDSIMLEYPIGPFLFWNVKKKVVNDNEYSMYEFIRDYHEKDNFTNKYVNKFIVGGGGKDYIWSVLDGQQRLSSLYIAIMGSMSRRLPGKHKNNDKSYPEKKLYFNLHSGPNSAQKTGDDEVTYEFAFLTKTEAEDNEKMWYKVSDIIQYTDQNDVMTNVVNKKNWNNDEPAKNNLLLLHQRIMTDETIYYHEVKSESMDDVLDIFVRLNSGGTPLSKTDLLFSTVISHWDEGRKKIDQLLSFINNIGHGFGFSSDFIMRTCLYLLDFNISMKIESFKKENVDKIEGNWDNIEGAVTDTVNLLDQFGFFGNNIISYNAIMPIIYYRYHNNVKFDKSDSNKTNPIKEELNKYFVAAQLKQIFGASSNTVLTKIREVLVTEKKEKKPFTLASLQNINFKSGKTLCFTDEEIENLFDKHEKNAYTFMILTLLYPNLKYGQHGFDQDHMHPFAGFDGKKLNGLILPSGAKIAPAKIKDWQRRRNTLANLQLLEKGDNESKNATPLKDWLAANSANMENVKFLPVGISYELNNFEQFLEERKKLMFKALKDILPQDNTPAANPPAP